MLGARVLRVRLDPLERRLGAHPLDLELGDEDGHLARGVCDECDRPLGRQEAEAREVLDVGLVEEHVAGQRVARMCWRSVSRLAASSAAGMPVACTVEASHVRQET